jgi:muconolactone delta-isomerase
MLFHVTMTHTAENCPGYYPEKMPDFMAGLKKLDGIAEELNIKMHFLVNAAPDHVMYALLEADEQSSIIRFLHSLPLRQDFRITPVMHQKDLIAMSEAQMGGK